MGTTTSAKIFVGVSALYVDCDDEFIESNSDSELMKFEPYEGFECPSYGVELMSTSDLSNFSLAEISDEVLDRATRKICDYFNIDESYVSLYLMCESF